MEGARWDAPFLLSKAAYKQAPALEKAQQAGTIVWSVEVRGGGSRRYNTAGVKTFYDWYKAGIDMGRSMHWYEDIAEDGPCKLFFDLDGPPGYDLERATQIIHDLFAPAFHREHLAMVIIDASTPKKASRHIICQNAILKDIHHAKRLVHSLIPRLPEDVRSVLDEAIYTKNRPFRLLGSTKFGRKTGKLVWTRYHNEHGEIELDWNDPEACFMMSLISFIPYLDELGLVPLTIPEPAKVLRKKQYPSSESVDLKVEGATMRNFKWFPDSRVICYWVYGTPCAWNHGKAHKKRWLMIKMNLRRGIQTTRCLDPYCRRLDFDKKRISKENLRWAEDTISRIKKQ